MTDHFLPPIAPSVGQPPLGIITLDESGQVTAWNPVAEKIFGWREEETLGRFPPHIPPDQISLFLESVYKALMGQPQTLQQAMRRHKDGSLLNVNAWMVAIPRSGSTTAGVLEVVENFSNQETPEHMLVHTAILNSVTAHVIVLDGTGFVTAVNQGGSQQPNRRGQGFYQVEEGQDYLAYLRVLAAKEEAPSAQAILEGVQTVVKGSRAIFEMEYCVRDGEEERWYATRIAPLDKAGGGAVITHEDVTRRRLAETARLMAEKRLAAILGIAADCIIAIDGNRRVLLFNRWAEHVFGYTADEIIGQPIDILVPSETIPDHTLRIKKYIDQNVEAGYPDLLITNRLVVSGVRKDGSRFPAESSFAMITFENQPIMVAVIRDITERLRAENQLRLYAKRQVMLTDVSLQINKLQTIPEISHLVTEQAREIIGAHLAITTHSGGARTDRSVRACARSEKYAAHSELELVLEKNGLCTLATPHGTLRTFKPEELLQAPILRRDGTPLGVIQLADKNEGAFDETDSAALVQLAQVAGGAMENSLLYDEIRQAEQRYRSIFENSNEGLFQLTPSGELISGNPSLARLLGYRDIAELLADQPEIRLYIFARPQDYDDLRQQLERGEEVSGYEARFRTRDGGLRWVSLNINTHATTQDGALIYEGSIRDISERKRRLRELEALAEISTSLRPASNQAEMVPIILRQLEHSLGSEHALFFLMLEGGVGLVELAHGHWAEMSGQTIPAGPLLDTLSNVPAPRLFNHGGQPIPDLPLFQGYTSLVAAPIQTLGQGAGSLWLGLRGKTGELQSSEYSDEDATLLGTIAEVASNAIVRSSLNEQIERRLRTILALHSIDMAISNSMDARLTTRTILEQGATLLGVDAMNILRYDAITKQLVYASGQGFQTRLVEQIRHQVGEGITGQAALDRRMVVLEQPARESACKYARLAQVEKFDFYAAAPLVAKGQLKGMLEVFAHSPLPASNEWRDLLETLATEAAIALDNNQLFEELQRSNIELTLAYDATIQGWARALELKDRETEGHSQRVTHTTLRLAQRLGVPAEELVHIQRGAQLHDIGKMGIPDSILLKPGPLDDEERTIMRTHVQLGLSMLAGIPFLKRALDIPRAHHERWDGNGYPSRLKGLQIPLAARIFAVIDVWDALSYDRPYRGAWPQEQVLAYLKEESGKHFDPEVLKAFLEMIQEEDFMD